MTIGEERLEKLLRDVEGRLTKRMDELDAKVDKAADFQTIFLGAVKILTALVILGAGIATIYVAFHTKTVGPK